MSTIIHLTTHINAPITKCFELSISVDVHQQSTGNTREKAIAGVASGMMELNDTVTWEAVHFGVKQKLTSKITKYQYPFYFVDEMVNGAFKKIYHQHVFTESGNTTTMTDIFEYAAPLGALGKLAEKLFLNRYLKNFLIERNNYIKLLAEQRMNN
ncbi:MAG: SRPBCC family protein [Bacteroidetes bacterium]|nr:SRPBCC family protein [Bacteroidota bacterium]